MTVLFITGTDTDVGKTFVTLKLLKGFNVSQKTIALKPISSGAKETALGLANDDALLLQAASSFMIPLCHVNPFVFKEAIAPHIAAAKVQINITAEMIVSHIKEIQNTYTADQYLIEGAGGLMVPINADETWIDVIKKLDCDIILVVPIKLGCLNHAFLTQEVLNVHQLKLKGWIANCLDPNCLYPKELIDTLKAKLAAPLLHVYNYEK